MLTPLAFLLSPFPILSLSSLSLPFLLSLFSPRSLPSKIRSLIFPYGIFHMDKQYARQEAKKQVRLFQGFII